MNKILSKGNISLCPLSVVVVAVYNSTHVANCLSALTRQVVAPHTEIIVVYHEGVNDIQMLKEKFPLIHFYCAHGQQTQAKMLTQGINQAKGEIVALTVDHCTPARNWCSKILELHDGPYAAVGGGLEMGMQPHTAVNWAVHFYDYCSYGYYQHPVKQGPARELSDCNVAYKRRILEKSADLWGDGFNVPLMNRALLDQKESLWFSPELVVYQHRSISFVRAAHVAYRRGRAFASARVANCTRLRQLFYMILSLLLPLKLLGKLMINLVPKRSHLGALALAFPYIILFASLWSCGEFVGFYTRRLNTIITVIEE